MAHIEDMDCCGYREIASIGREGQPSEVIEAIIEDLCYGDGPGYQPGGYVFTSTEAQNNYAPGRRLAAFIKRRALGAVVKHRPMKKPRTGRKITMWTWTVNWKNMIKSEEFLDFFRDRGGYDPTEPIVDWNAGAKEEFEDEIARWRQAIAHPTYPVR